MSNQKNYYQIGRFKFMKQNFLLKKHIPTKMYHMNLHQKNVRMIENVGYGEWIAPARL